MKSVLLAFALLSSAPAFAAALGPQNISLTCDSHELAPGSVAHNGQVTLQLSTDGKYINSPWAVTVLWKGVDEALVQPGSVCGMAIADSCFENTRGWTNGVFSLTQECGVGGFDTRGLPHHAADVNIVLARGADGVSHGRFYCAAYEAGNYASVELTNCK